jgi:hypothetical protein
MRYFMISLGGWEIIGWCWVLGLGMNALALISIIFIGYT